MRFTILAVAVALPMSAVAGECGVLSNYGVPTLNFNRMSVEDAVNVVMDGTPFKVDVSMIRETNAKVSAKSVSGRLDTVLSALAKQAGITYKQDGCLIVFSPPEKPFVVEEGALLSETLKKWTDQAHWDFVWLVSNQEDFQLLAKNTFRNGFKNAVSGLFSSLPPGVRLSYELRPENDPPLLYVTRDEGLQK